MRYLRLLSLILAIAAPGDLPSAGGSGRSAAPPAPKVGPPFALRQEKDAWWLVTPEGKRFFSLGVCCVETGSPWLEYNPKNPGYAAWQEYKDPVDWADATVDRLKSWGFTTIGGWSDYTTLRRTPKMTLAMTPVLHLGSSSGAPWWDMWDPKIIATMEDVAKKQILALREDPRLLGYYTDNEMGWWNAALFKLTLEQSPLSGQRLRLLQILRNYYQNDWRRLRRDFIPEGVDSFAALDRGGKLFLRPGGDGMKPMRQFLSMVAERYYTLMRQVVRKFDRRGLILGDRYQSFYYPEVARAAQRGVDAVSTNLNPNWNDGTFARFYLNTLHVLAQKPLLIGEFYMTAMENRSGNKNDSSGFPVVPTQRERAAGFRTTLEALVKTPYVAGADWFQYSDEPMFGRGDGENYDMGLVDIHDKPYTELTEATRLDRDSAHAAPVLVRPDVSGGVPPAPKDPLANWKPMEAMRAWDRERGFVPPTSPNPVADMYLCWNEEAVYVGLYAMDIVEDLYYKDKKIPEADRAEWSLRPGSRPQPFHIRLGAGRAPSIPGAEVTVVNLSGADHDVRNIAAARIPAALFGKRKLHAGDTIELTSTLLTNARAYKVMWGGTFKLAE